MKFGCDRIGAKEQSLDLQMDALKNAGCEEIFSYDLSMNGSNKVLDCKALMPLLIPLPHRADSCLIFSLV